jgi:L-aminopeptidase/D-esterase-like protein
MPCPHAFYLSGGSAFGLDGATGVQSYLESRGIGYDAGVARVPIVAGAVIFDLNVGSAKRRPDREMGMEACRNAGVKVPQGNVGAGTGATSGWAAGLGRRMKTGLGTASCRAGDLIVGAIVAVNCWGDVLDPATAEILAGTLNDAGDGFAGSQRLLTAHPMGVPTYPSHSTIGMVASNAKLDKAMASRVAMMAHDGYARAIVPVHTFAEGDIIFSAVTGAIDASVSVVGALAAAAMVQAIMNAVTSAESAYGYPGYQEVLERRRKKTR